MRFNRKVTIWRLNNVSLSYPLHLFRHLALLFEAANMLNNRIGDHYFKLFIVELAHIPCIANNRSNSRKCRFDWLCIQNGEMDIILDEAHDLPKNLRATHVKDVEWPGKTGKEGFKEIETLSAKIDGNGSRPG